VKQTCGLAWLSPPAWCFAVVVDDLTGGEAEFHVRVGPEQPGQADERRGRVVQDEAGVGKLLGKGDELAGGGDVDEIQSCEVEVDSRGGRQGCECLAEPGLSGEVCLAFEPQPCPARQRAHSERSGAVAVAGDQVMPGRRLEALHYLDLFNSSFRPLQWLARARKEVQDTASLSGYVDHVKRI
jgi:hypothetical protein